MQHRSWSGHLKQCNPRLPRAGTGSGMWGGGSGRMIQSPPHRLHQTDGPSPLLLHAGSSAHSTHSIQHCTTHGACSGTCVAHSNCPGSLASQAHQRKCHIQDNPGPARVGTGFSMWGWRWSVGLIWHTGLALHRYFGL